MKDSSPSVPYDQSAEPAGTWFADQSQLADLIDEMANRLEAGQSVEIDSLVERYPALAQPLRAAHESLVGLHAAATLPLGDTASETRRLGDFRIRRELGRGGMGIVYEAEQVSLGRDVAVKVLPLAGLLDAAQLARFKNEARAAAMLKHPNIVSVLSVGSERGVHYYAMELIDGLSLAELIATTARRSPQPRTAARQQQRRQLTSHLGCAVPKN